MIRFKTRPVKARLLFEGDIFMFPKGSIIYKVSLTTRDKIFFKKLNSSKEMHITLNHLIIKAD